ncbi:MAG: glycosyltransferase family 2 protein [Chitinophagales bacterium]|nr:glycosyltransferase family 2 protein [Chitinophagales bacterium]
MNDLSHLHTFVIAAYGESPYLEDCIKSVQNQSCKSTVLITTSTPSAYIETLANKYCLPLQINPNGGSIGKDWNFALQAATTDYVTIAHQDDLYQPEYTEKHVTALLQYQAYNPLIAFGKSEVYNNRNKPVNFPFKNFLRWWLIFPFHFKRCINSVFIKKSILLFSNSISCPGVCFAKRNLQRFCFNEKRKYILDWEAWYEMSQVEGAFVYVNYVSHIHREHEESATSTTQLSILQHEELELLKTIWKNRIIPNLIVRLLSAAK